MRNLPVLYKEKKDCCGCEACYTICELGAIDMKKDEEGFEYPHINKERCVRCYRCIKVCPLKSGESR